MIRNKAIVFVLVVLIIARYFYVFCSEPINFPFGDEFERALNFINKYNSTDSILAKIKFLFINSNEHKNLFYKSIVVIQYSIFGKINFHHLLVFGNVGLIALFAFFSWQSKLGIYVVGLALLFFQYSFYGLSLWALPSIQHFYVILFSSLTFYFLLLNNKNYYLGFLTGFLAVFTFGNGMLVLPIGAYLLYRNNKNILLKWIVFSVGIVVFYFCFHFVKVSHHNSKNFIDFIRFFSYLPSLLSAFSNVTNTIFYHLIGWLIFIFASIIIVKSDKSDFFKYLLLFLMVSVVIISLGRTQFGLESSKVSRYQIYPVLILAIVYIYIVKKYVFNLKTRLRFLIFSIPLLVNIMSFENNKIDIKTRKNKLMEQKSSLFTQHFDLTDVYKNNNELYQSFLTRSIINNFFLNNYNYRVSLISNNLLADTINTIPIYKTNGSITIYRNKNATDFYIDKSNLNNEINYFIDYVGCYNDTIGVSNWFQIINDDMKRYSNNFIFYNLDTTLIRSGVPAKENERPDLVKVYSKTVKNPSYGSYYMSEKDDLICGKKHHVFSVLKLAENGNVVSIKYLGETYNIE